MMRRAPDFVIGPPADPYLRRWWVIPRNYRFNIYLHHFLHSDEDRALHDHPWINCSILLKGSYLEHLPSGEVKLRKAWRPWAPWRLVFRKPKAAHRIELLAANGKVLSAWSLFLTGPTVRTWGFHCPRGWVDWRTFTKQDAPGEVGRGCGE